MSIDPSQQASQPPIDPAQGPISSTTGTPEQGSTYPAAAAPPNANAGTTGPAVVPELARTGDLSAGSTEQKNNTLMRNTVPLVESAAPPVPTLSERAVLDGRYRVVTLLGSLSNTNLYRVQDLEGFRHCWACGSTASVEGETYCVDCGAQLTGRYYRLQEFNMPITGDESLGSIAQALLPAPILENEVPGVAHVYDVMTSPDATRAYVVWEEVYGRALSEWMQGAIGGTMVELAPPSSSGQLPIMDDPEEEQALFWLAQSAEVLFELHAQNITGCGIGLNNLVVQPGDKIALVDPLGCTLTGNDPEAFRADVRRLAAELEAWYIAVRNDQGAEISAAPEPQAAQGPLVPSVDEVTGPLSSATNTAVVLSKAREGVYPTAEEFAQTLYELYETSRPANNLKIWSGGASDVGRVRQVNEDSVITLEARILDQEGSIPVGLYVVADGMGGHQSGEVASSIAIRTIGSVINSALLGPLVAGDPVASNSAGLAAMLQNAVLEANRRIYQLAAERHSDLGTTVTLALLVGSQLTVANVGDSRTYVMRDGQLEPITRDHSLVAQLVAAGQLNPDDIYSHPRRNEIYRALGDPHLTVTEVDTFSHRLQPGDTVLLCSDGLWDFVRDPAISAILTASENLDPNAACKALIDRANSVGGEDNISTIVIRVLPQQENKAT